LKSAVAAVYTPPILVARAYTKSAFKFLSGGSHEVATVAGQAVRSSMIEALYQSSQFLSCEFLVAT